MAITFIQKKINNSRMLFDLKAKVFKSKDVATASTQLGSYLDEIIKAIEMPTYWNSKYHFELEMKKSFARGLVRSSPQSHKLLKSVLTGQNLAYLSRKVSFTALPYPIIHLASDVSEPGGYHIDQVGNSRYITVWTPTTQNLYAPLSHLKGGIICWKFINPEKISKLNAPIQSNVGDCLIFGGGFVHRGNLNTSTKVSSASVIRLSKEPIKYERVRHLKEIESLDLEPKILARKDIKNIYAKYKDLVNFLAHNPATSPLQTHLIRSVKNYVRKLELESNSRQCLSFSLSMLAQRLSTYSTTEKKNIIHATNIASILLGSENLGAVELLIKDLSPSEKDDFLKTLYQADVFDAIPINTQQWQHVIHNPDYKKYEIWKF